jgi:hypothetical protein
MDAFLGFTIILVFLGWLCYWPVFERANQPGWAAFVPIYNMVVLCRIANKSRWWVLPACIPYLGIFLQIPLLIAVARSFGRGRAFGVGMALLPFVFVPILAFREPE